MSTALRTSRVVVIDDTPEEALPLMEALSKMEIGAIYLRGRQEEMGIKLNGIRLAFVDLQLQELTDDESTVEYACRYLSNVLDGEDDSPLAVLVWTARGELAERFNRRLRSTFPNRTPCDALPIQKGEFRVDQENYNITAIQEAIRAAVSQNPALQALWAWEQAVHNAASHTTHELNKVIGALSESHQQWVWNRRATEVLAALARAGSDLPPRADSDALSYLFEALHQIHFDRLEAFQRQQGWTSIIESSAIAGLTARYAQLKSPAEAEFDKTKLQSMLHLGKPLASRGLLPGHLYVFNLPDLSELPTVVGLDLAVLGSDCSLKQEHAWHPVLVDVTPVCDVAQGKAKSVRVVAGAVVNMNNLQTLKAISTKGNSEFLRFLGPYEISGTPSGWELGRFALVLNSHFVFGVTEEMPMSWRPVGRLRQSVLTDVQHWLAHMQSRPGMITLQ